MWNINAQSVFYVDDDGHQTQLHGEDKVPYELVDDLSNALNIGLPFDIMSWDTNTALIYFMSGGTQFPNKPL